MGDSLAFVKRIWRRYDIALSAQAGDRALINAWLAAPLRHSHMKTTDGHPAWLRAMIQHRIPADDDTHAVIHGLRLLDPLGIERDYALVPPVCSPAAKAALDGLLPFSRQCEPYVVLHPYPRNRYKCWTTPGWRSVARHAAARGQRVIVTGGAGSDEQRCIHDILDSDLTRSVIDLSGQLALPQVSDLLAGASLYIGPDTGITHLAAACGVPCIALYGPTSPVYWGPWPRGHREDRPPFVKRGGSQRNGNVIVILTDGECFACGREGCGDDPGLPSACMERLSPDMVLGAMEELSDAGIANDGRSSA